MPILVAIIEDNKDIRESFSALLNGSEGFSCVAAFENAEDAMTALPDVSADVALVDIHLPKISGIDCIREMKERCPGTQFLIFTVFEDNENIFNALEAGAAGYVLKSTPPAKILEAIQDIYHGGSPMSSQIARKVVASFKQRVEPNREMQLLSAREKEILEYLSKGLRYKEIAGRLFISTETVRTHIRNIYTKLHVQSRTEAVNKAYSKK